MRNILLSIVLFSIALVCKAQTPVATDVPVPLKYEQRKMDSLEQVRFFRAKKYAAKTTTSGTVFDTTQWAHRIDTTWGPGLPSAQKLEVFNKFWGQIDSQYSGFTGLPHYNWDSIVTDMRAEITAGVSRGRFAGIATQLTSLLNDAHTRFADDDLYATPFFFGEPLLYGPTGNYGVCLTMLNDSSAMVYTAQPGNVLGLAPGDRVLGYNGIPWKTLLGVLARHKLPSNRMVGSTDSATLHRQIISVLSNFHLFDTLNIEKCDGTLINYPTSILVGAATPNNFCKEQMEVPGVHTMTYTDYFINNRVVTSGVISGTRIGYVALYDCSDYTGDSMFLAVQRLAEDSLVEGLIIDIRTNFGGSYFAFNRAFYYLSSGYFPWIGCAKRNDPTNHFTMDASYISPASYGTYDPDPAFFNKKIALLVGPGAVSAGDMMQVLFAHHPNLKSFGKPTAGAFGGLNSMAMPYTGYIASRQNGDFYKAEDDTRYLSHHNFPVDSIVWFERDKVCNNQDNILSTAIEWIHPSVTVQEVNSAVMSANIYPVPSTGPLNISITSPAATVATVTIYDMVGKRVVTQQFDISAGENKLKLSCGTNAANGSYLVQIDCAGQGTMIKKVVIAK